MLLGLASLGCDRSGLKSRSTDGATPDLPVDTGGSLLGGSGGAGGNGQGDAGGDLFSPATVQASVAVLDFGTVDVGASSAPQTVVVTVGGASTTLAPTVSGAGFAIAGTTCGNPQTVGSCTVSVVFAPATMGAANGVLILGTASVALAGIGNPHPTFGTPDRIDLGSVGLNQPVSVVIPIPAMSAAGTSCNANSANLTLTSQTCPTAGPITAPCGFTFTFKSSTVGAKLESVVCTSGGKASQTIVSATVVTAEPMALYPASASFTSMVGEQDVAWFSVPNNGGAPTGYLNVAITNGAPDFGIVSNACVGPLAPLATCKIQVGFLPRTVGNKLGTLRVTDESTGQSGVATLTGTALSAPSPTIRPTLQDFASVVVGQTETAAFTLTNYGGATLGDLDIVGGSADFTVDARTCNASVAPGAACTFAVSFTPTSAGTKSAIVTLVERSSSAVVGSVKVTGVGSVADAGPPGLDADYAVCFACGAFPSTPVGQVSPEVVCTTNGHLPDGGIAAIQPQLTGGDFAIVNQACTAAMCTVTLVFKPTAKGQRIGSLTMLNPDIHSGCSVDVAATGV